MRQQMQAFRDMRMLLVAQGSFLLIVSTPPACQLLTPACYDGCASRFCTGVFKQGFIVFCRDLAREERNKKPFINIRSSPSIVE
jgi:hypothetical protein